MTIPFDYCMDKTIEKIKTTENGDVFLTEPEYHNKGVKDGGDSLSYRTYGKSLFEKLTCIGFNVEYLDFQIPKYAISKMEIFLCRKNYLSEIEKIDEDVQVLTKELFMRNSSKDKNTFESN